MAKRKYCALCGAPLDGIVYSARDLTDNTIKHLCKAHYSSILKQNREIKKAHATAGTVK